MNKGSRFESLMAAFN